MADLFYKIQKQNTMLKNIKYSFAETKATIRKNSNSAQRNLYKALGAALALSLFVFLIPFSALLAFVVSAYVIGVTWNFIIIQPGILSINGFVCNYGFSDTGVPCTVIQKVAQRMFMVPFYNNFGSQNGIRLNGTVSTTTNATFVQPCFGFTVSVTFTSTAGFYQGMVFYGADSTGHTGWYSVTSITSSTVAVIQNIGITGSSAQGVTIATTMAVTDVVTFNNAFYTNMINHPDASQRWYPTPLFKNASNKRGASIMKSYDDQTESKVQEGVRKFTTIIPGKFASPQFTGAAQSGYNLDFGVYIIDKDQNQIGQVDNPASIGWLYPVKVDANSLDVIYNPGDDKNEQETMINFNFDNTAVDTYLNALAGSKNGINGDIDPAANLLNIPAVLNVSAIISSIATSSAGTFKVQLKTVGGSALSVVNDTGLVVSNFISPVTGLAGKVYDATAAADVTVSSCVEEISSTGRPTGVYDITLGSDPVATHKISLGFARANRNYSGIPAQAGQNPNYTFASV